MIFLLTLFLTLFTVISSQRVKITSSPITDISEYVVISVEIPPTQDILDPFDLEVTLTLSPEDVTFKSIQGTTVATGCIGYSCINYLDEFDAKFTNNVFRGKPTFYIDNSISPPYDRVIVFDIHLTKPVNKFRVNARYIPNNDIERPASFEARNNPDFAPLATMDLIESISLGIPGTYAYSFDLVFNNVDISQDGFGLMIHSPSANFHSRSYSPVCYVNNVKVDVPHDNKLLTFNSTKIHAFTDIRVICEDHVLIGGISAFEHGVTVSLYDFKGHTHIFRVDNSKLEYKLYKLMLTIIICIIVVLVVIVVSVVMYSRNRVQTDDNLVVIESHNMYSDSHSHSQQAGYDDFLDHTDDGLNDGEDDGVGVIDYQNQAHSYNTRLLDNHTPS